MNYFKIKLLAACTISSLLVVTPSTATTRTLQGNITVEPQQESTTDGTVIQQVRPRPLNRDGEFQTRLLPQGTDSEELDKRAVHGMTAHTQGHRESWTSMQDVYNFVSIPGNRCSMMGESRNTCFVSITIPHLGATSTTGTNSCPVDYEAVIRYGNSILFNGREVLYYNGDVHYNIANWDEFNFYRDRNYACGQDPSRTFNDNWNSQGSCGNNLSAGTTNPDWYRSGSITNHSTPATGYQNILLYVTRPNYINYRVCHISGDLHHNGADDSCERCIAATHWHYYHSVRGNRVKCQRSAGYYYKEDMEFPTYPVAAVSGGSISPTVVICGKIVTRWNRKE